ncbi:hypothetical protein FKW77_007304 [Venturia effusa]|uniref:BTB domain-containing protein n=1 Tax=Venturia effusa TaxID=50376 RepID=A0A517L1J8_9PEZI|nr:hypothetical protein FKW77_007304 [Venturia effusa]
MAKLNDAIPKLLGSQEYSDLQIICHGKVFYVHKAIDDLDAVTAMIEFLYCDDYKQNENCSLGNGILHLKTHCIADKYVIDGLLDLAESKFFTYTTKWGSDQDAFTAAVKWIFENLPIGHVCRKIAVLGALRRLPQLLEDEAGLFSKLLKEIDNVRQEMARAARVEEQIYFSRRYPEIVIMQCLRSPTYCCKAGCRALWRWDDENSNGTSESSPTCPDTNCSKVSSKVLTEILDNITLLHAYIYRGCLCKFRSSIAINNGDGGLMAWECPHCHTSGLIARLRNDD